MGWGDPFKGARKSIGGAAQNVLGGNPVEKVQNLVTNPASALTGKKDPTTQDFLETLPFVPAQGLAAVDRWSGGQILGGNKAGDDWNAIKDQFQSVIDGNNNFMAEGDAAIENWYNSRPDLNPYGDDTKIKDINLGTAQTVDPDGKFNQAYGNIAGVETGNPYAQALDAFGSLQDFASSQGPSNIAQAQLDFQNTQQQTAEDNAARQAASSAATAYDNLALTGGASSGARERLLDSAGQNQMNALQGISNQGLQARQGIIASDEARKFDTLSSLPGMGQALDAYSTGIDRGNQNFEFNRLGAQVGLADRDAGINNDWTLQQAGLDRDANTFNANTAIRGVDQSNMYDQEGWRTQGDIIGSKYTADAMLRGQQGNQMDMFNPLKLGPQPIPGLLGEAGRKIMGGFSII
jgi:hypothetical protein